MRRKSLKYDVWSGDGKASVKGLKTIRKARFVVLSWAKTGVLDSGAVINRKIFHRGEYSHCELVAAIYRTNG